MVSGKAVLGIIGGSGIYDLPGLTDKRTEVFTSPWGEPSSVLHRGRIGQTEIVFLPRHGEGHRLSPSQINYRANIDVLKRAGVTDLVSLSACGSFREDLPPGMVVLVDQFVDLTRKRESSFFGSGCVAHVSLAHPVGPVLSARLKAAAAAERVPVHDGGTYVCIEGPQFSTRAESLLYRAQGFDVIGMTAMPEAKLAREAQIAYTTLALVTDFDCWHPREAHVTANAAIANLMKNAGHAQQIAVAAIRLLGAEAPVSIAHTALESALVTQPSEMAPDVLERLRVILD